MLTDELRARVDRSLKAEPAMRPMLGRAGYVVEQQGPWTRANSKERIGTAVQIRLTRPVDVAMQKWPSMQWNDAGDDYATQTIEASYKGMAKLVVFLDTGDRVVGVEPIGHGAMTLGPSSQWMRGYTPQGGDR